MQLDAKSYLQSGSNELRILEYRSCGHSYGINILKVQKIVAQPECLTRSMHTHPSVRGMFRDNGLIIPLIDMANVLGFKRPESKSFTGKIIITEFFGVLNGFWIDTVEWIHHFHWEDVIDAHNVMKSINQRYIIGIVKPDGKRMVPMLDYEAIILDICPELGANEMRKINRENFNGQGKRVLIAEDSPSVRTMLATELTELGFNIVTANDGKQAWNILENDKQFDLVISDVEMPQMDGLALTCAIRTNPEIQDMPVIVYSSIGDIGMKNRAEFLKANAHITKLNVELLLETAKKLTTNKTAQISDLPEIVEEPVGAE